MSPNDLSSPLKPSRAETRLTQLVNYAPPADHPFNIVWPKGQTFPFPRLEIEPNEFLYRFYRSGWGVDYMYYTQLVHPDTNIHVTAQTYYFLDHCLMVTHHYISSAHPTHPRHVEMGELMLPTNNPSDGLFMQFWRLGCFHEHLTENTPRMFTHNYLCEDCGLTYSTDSSG